MAREGKDFDDEIDLVALVLLFWGHRGKFAALGIAGLVLGLAFTYQHAPYYVTDFKVALGHPIYNEALLMESTGMQKLLNDGALNPASLPRLTYQNKTATFQLVTNTTDIRAPTSAQIRAILTESLALQQVLALGAESYKDKQVIINTTRTLVLSNRDLGNIDVNSVLAHLQISFGETQSPYPDPMKHGARGLLAGLFLAGCLMLVSLFAKALRESLAPRR